MTFKILDARPEPAQALAQQSADVWSFGITVMETVSGNLRTINIYPAPS